MADESRWWPQIMGHVLRYGVGHKDRDRDRTAIGTLVFCTNGRDLKFNYRAYWSPDDIMSNHIYRGNDLEECRDRIAEYFRTREMFPVDQE